MRLLLSFGLTLILTVIASGQTPVGLAEVSGIVMAANQEVIPAAKVILRGSDGAQGRKTTTSATGSFRFARVAAGSYELEAQKEGFKPALARVTVGARSSAPLEIVLSIADLRDEVAITERTLQTSTNPSENLDVVSLDRQMLDNLPTLGNDIIGSVSRLLDAGSLGAGGVTLVVDGMETSEKGVSASAVKEVRINQNPYSAEFSRPGRGRIEIITNPGAPEYHGAFNFIFRDHHLDARNAFTLERPTEQRRIYEGNITGPIAGGKKTSFLISVNREEEDLQAVAFAQTPSGLFRGAIPTPQRVTEISARVNRQVGKKHTISFRYEFTDESGKGGVGGFSLPEVGSTSTNREHHIYYNHRTLFTPNLINDLSVRAGTHDAFTRSLNPGVRKLVVLDAFTGGGAQADRRSTENHVQLTDVMSWSHGRHFVKTGINVPDLSRRGSTDRANFDGAFFFSSLADFARGLPFLFSVNQGEGRLIFWQKEIGLFIQDEIRVRPNFSLAVGVRYDWQNSLRDHNNLAPRLSFAFAPTRDRKTVLRGGIGYFYDRTGQGPMGETFRFDGRRLRQIIISNPGFPDPLSAGGTFSEQPSSIVRFAPDLRAPYTIQHSFGIERQLAKSLTLAVNYISARGVSLFRSRDVNAPLTPLSPRPDPTIGVLRQIESSAFSRSHTLEFNLRGNLSRFFSGTAQYVLGRANNDTGGIGSLPANSYDLFGEWSRADFDDRHRFNLLGALKAGKYFNLGLALILSSGRPYSLITGRDDNKDTVANDRPAGVRRNTLQGTGSATLDLRWSRDFFLSSGKKDKGPTATIGIDAFNVLNRVNYTGFVGNLSSPFFGQPVAARQARRVQLAFSFRF